VTVGHSTRFTMVHTVLPLLSAQGERAAWISQYAVYTDGFVLDLQLDLRLCLPLGPPAPVSPGFVDLTDGGGSMSLSVTWPESLRRTVTLPLAKPGRDRATTKVVVRTQADVSHQSPAAADPLVPLVTLLGGTGDAEHWQQQIWVSPIPATGDLVVSLAEVAGTPSPVHLGGKFLREMAGRLL
jgi:hypothetical protein